MTEKTLGQVAWEAAYVDVGGLGGSPAPWESAAQWAKDDWERIGVAVAEVVREQCAQEARAHYRLTLAAAEMRPLHISEWDASPAIRSMKL